MMMMMMIKIVCHQPWIPLPLSFILEKLTYTLSNVQCLRRSRGGKNWQDERFSSQTVTVSIKIPPGIIYHGEKRIPRRITPLVVDQPTSESTRQFFFSWRKNGDVSSVCSRIPDRPVATSFIGFPLSRGVSNVVWRNTNPAAFHGTEDRAGYVLSLRRLSCLRINRCLKAILGDPADPGKDDS